MRHFILAAAFLLSASAQAQIWRTNLMGGLAGVPSSFRDVERFEGYLAAALPYCGGLGAADWGGYRGMVGTWTGYLMSMNAAARDHATRAAAVRALRSVSLFPCAYPNGQPRPAEAPVPPPQPAPPPFALQPPELPGLSGADQEQATELRQRYGFAASRASTAWNNAEVLKISLGLRGMSVNADTSANVNRLKPMFDEVTEFLKAKDWDMAKLRLQGIETVTKRITDVVGQ